MTATVRDYGLGPRFGEHDGGFPLIRHIIGLRPEGTAVEFGVAAGNSLRIITEHMPAVGFDSFQGLPEPWCEFPAGSMNMNGVIPTVPNAKIVVGLFADTLPGFDFAALGPIGLVHFDADLYSSTKTALQYVGEYLRPGTFVCFDEWGHRWHSETASHEQRAWEEFVTETGTDWDVVGHDSEAWAIRLKDPA